MLTRPRGKGGKAKAKDVAWEQVYSPGQLHHHGRSSTEPVLLSVEAGPRKALGNQELTHCPERALRQRAGSLPRQDSCSPGTMPHPRADPAGCFGHTPFQNPSGLAVVSETLPLLPLHTPHTHSKQLHSQASEGKEGRCNSVESCLLGPPQPVPVPWGDYAGQSARKGT